MRFFSAIFRFTSSFALSAALWLSPMSDSESEVEKLGGEESGGETGDGAVEGTEQKKCPSSRQRRVTPRR